jgi:hypothetical protein
MSLMPGWYQTLKHLQFKAIEEFATNYLGECGPAPATGRVQTQRSAAKTEQPIAAVKKRERLGGLLNYYYREAA